MSSDSLKEGKKEDDEENPIPEMIEQPQEPHILEIEETTDVEIVKGKETGQTLETDIKAEVESQVSQKEDETRVSISGSGGKIIEEPVKSETEAKVSVPNIDEKILVRPIKSKTERPIPGGGMKIDVEEPETIQADETIQGKPVERPKPFDEDGEGDAGAGPPPEGSIQGEGAESEEQDWFGEEPWAPCDEKPEQIQAYGEGGSEGEETTQEELGEEEEEEEEAEPVDEKISMDSEYLKSCLGAPLTYALLDIIAKRPTDPIHYLGHYLIRWRANGESKDKFEKDVEVLTAERQLYMEHLREKERQKMLEKEQKEEEYRRVGRVESSLEDDDDDSDDEDEEDVVTQSEKGSSVALDA